jgi:hypothetical protein
MTILFSCMAFPYFLSHHRVAVVRKTQNVRAVRKAIRPHHIFQTKDDENCTLI